MALEQNPIDTSEYVCSITPSEFEVFCKEILECYAKENQLIDFVIEHDVKIEAHDGTYQIDVYAKFKAVGVTFKILCECKQYKNKVKREVVQTLKGKLDSLGMNKGIIMSTAGFQKGAIQYARDHGIDLLQVYDHSCEAVSYSGVNDVIPDPKDPFVYCRTHWPKYKVICYFADNKEVKTVYPTSEMIEEIYKEMDRLTKEMYGFSIFRKI